MRRVNTEQETDGKRGKEESCQSAVVGGKKKEFLLLFLQGGELLL